MKSVLNFCLALIFTLSLASSSKALVVALSNDDGWDAPGVQAMKTEIGRAHV